MKTVLHMQKLNSYPAISALDSHNQRLKNVENADSAGIIQQLKGNNILTDVRMRIDNLPKRKDSVLATTSILSASPEYFRPECPEKAGYYEPEKLTKWVDASISWLENEFKENFVNATLHLDEATPHIHAIITPVIDGRLSAKRMFNPTSLKIHQTNYAKAVEHLGIQRGQKNSKATHSDVKEYYQKVNSELPSLRQEITQKEKQLNKLDLDIQTRSEQNKTYEEEISIKQEVIKKLANEVRGIDLKFLAQKLGYQQDSLDHSKWKHNHNIISINNNKFYSHTIDGFKGGGAIDFIIKNNHCDFKTAVSYLSDMDISVTEIKKDVAINSMDKLDEDIASLKSEEKYIEIPKNDQSKLSPIKEYLSEIRKIPKKLVEYCISTLKNIYADNFGNAIFLHKTPEGEITGAEKRGTINTNYKGLAKGSNISESGGAFILPGNDNVVVTESAIDALSYKAISESDETIISVAGARNKAKIIDNLAIKNKKIKIAYKNNETGNNAYKLLQRENNNITRIVPPTGKDWNEHLINDISEKLRSQDKENTEQRSLKDYLPTQKANNPKSGLKEKLKKIQSLRFNKNSI